MTTRVNGSSSAERQFIRGVRYVDDLLLRDRDASGGGTLNERLYALQDANWNVTALSDASGVVQERYGYDGYGVPAVLTAAFGLRLASLYDWETRFGGYRWDGESGLYQVRRRCYHALLGCWLQRDPLGLAAGRNLYEYAAGGPGNHTDPSGEIIFLLLAAVGGLTMGAAFGYRAYRVTRNPRVALAAGFAGFTLGVLIVWTLGGGSGAAATGFGGLRLLGAASGPGALAFTISASQAVGLAKGLSICVAISAVATLGGGGGGGGEEEPCQAEYDACRLTALSNPYRYPAQVYGRTRCWECLQACLIHPRHHWLGRIMRGLTHRWVRCDYWNL